MHLNLATLLSSGFGENCFIENIVKMFYEKLAICKFKIFRYVLITFRHAVCKNFNCITFFRPVSNKNTYQKRKIE
jgi:hypothetical protein